MSRYWGKRVHIQDHLVMRLGRDVAALGRFPARDPFGNGPERRWKWWKWSGNPAAKCSDWALCFTCHAYYIDVRMVQKYRVSIFPKVPIWTHAIYDEFGIGPMGGLNLGTSG